MKGAYREPKSVAHQLKSDVDDAFVRLARRLLTDGTFPAIATHDEDILRRGQTLRVGAKHHGRIGMSSRCSTASAATCRKSFRDEGYRMRVYVPFGHEWFPYFMRSLGERPANVAFVMRSLIAER